MTSISNESDINRVKINTNTSINKINTPLRNNGDFSIKGNNIELVNLDIPKKNKIVKIPDSIEVASATGTTITNAIKYGGNKVIELTVDGLALGGSHLIKVLSIPSSTVIGFFSKDMKKSYDSMFDNLIKDNKQFIAEDIVGDGYEHFYTETNYGKRINEKSILKYDSKEIKKIQSVSQGASEIVAATGITVATGGLAAGVIGGVYGTGKSAENTYQQTLDTTAIQKAGIVFSGALTGLSWGANGKIMSSFIKNAGGSITSVGLKETGAKLVKSVSNKEFVKTWLKASIKDPGNYIASGMMSAEDLTPFINGEKELNLKNMAIFTGGIVKNFGLNVLDDGLRMGLGGFNINGTNKFAQTIGEKVSNIDNNKLSYSLNELDYSKLSKELSSDVKSGLLTNEEAIKVNEINMLINKLNEFDNNQNNSMQLDKLLRYQDSEYNKCFNRIIELSDGVNQKYLKNMINKSKDFANIVSESKYRINGRSINIEDLNNNIVLNKNKLLELSNKDNITFNEFKESLGGKKLEKVFDETTIGFMFDNFKEEKTIYILDSLDKSLDDIQKLLNNEIPNDLTNYFCIKPSYILSLSDQDQSKLAKSFANGNTELENSLKFLWKNKIGTHACQNTSNLEYISFFVDSDNYGGIEKLQKILNQDNISVENIKYNKDSNQIEFVMRGNKLYNYISNYDKLEVSNNNKNKLLDNIDDLLNKEKNKTYDINDSINKTEKNYDFESSSKYEEIDYNDDMDNIDKLNDTFNESFVNKHYSLEQIMNTKNYKEMCDSLLDVADNSKSKQDLEEILYKGSLNGKGLFSGLMNRDNPDFEAYRRASMAELYLRNPDTLTTLLDNDVNLFHGTNANALPRILKHGVCSIAESNKKGLSVTTGESWSRVIGKDREFVSFTDILDISKYYSNIEVTGNHNDISFPIIIGTSKSDVNKIICNVRSNTIEVGVKNALPTESIKTICVPSDKVTLVKKMVSSTGIRVLPMDGMIDRTYSFDTDGGGFDIYKDAISKIKSSSTTKKFKIKDLYHLLFNV